MAERKDGHDAAAAASASSASTALDGVEGDGKTSIQDDAWLPSDSFVHEPPVLKVMQPKGTFCEIQARFSVALQPDGVYDIITDPNNRRVFKNIKEVCYRKVLEDDGNRQLVEVEQLGRWRFLMFSGTFSSRVMVEQNRQDHKMLFDLAKQGMMRKFSGTWKIDSMYASEQKSQAADSESEVVGSWVNFHQLLEPAILPPWPLSRYVRGSRRELFVRCVQTYSMNAYVSHNSTVLAVNNDFASQKVLFPFFLLCAMEAMLNKVY